MNQVAMKKLNRVALHLLHVKAPKECGTVIFEAVLRIIADDPNHESPSDFQKGLLGVTEGITL